MKRRQPFRQKEDEAMREWRQEFPEETRRAIFPIHTNLGHPQNSTLAKMITDTGGNEVIKCANRYPCSVCKRMSRPRLWRPVSVPRTQQFNDTLLTDVYFWELRDPFSCHSKSCHHNQLATYLKRS